MVQYYVVKDDATGEYLRRQGQRQEGDFGPFDAQRTYAGHRKEADKMRDAYASSTGRDLIVLALVASMAK